MAGPQIVVEMDADEAKMWQKLKKLEKAEGGVEAAMKRIGNATRDVSREHRALEREAKRLYDSTRTPQERYNAELRKAKQHLDQNRISTDTYRRHVDQLNRELLESQQAHTAAFGGVVQSNVSQLVGLLGFGGGVAGAVMAASGATETWLQNMREIGIEAKKAANEIIAFAALQEGGEKAKAVMEADALAVRYGINDRGEAFNTIQALQSAYGGDRQKGMEAASTVFAATQLGIPLESGRELEVLGASQGQAPGEAIRRAHVSGQASSRDPATISKAASGISFWDDPEVGFAAAGTLSAGVKEDELQTYLTRAGIGLSTVGNLEDWIKEQGLEEASQLDRLKRLSELSIDTPEELAGIGVDEVREQKALAILVRNRADVERILAEIRNKAKPGLLAEQRADVEAELPTTEKQRQIDVMKSAYKSEQAFGDSAIPAMEQELEDLARGMLYQRAGYTQVMLRDLIDEEGHSTWLDRTFAYVYDAVDRGFFDGGEGPSAAQLEVEIPKVIEWYKSAPGGEARNLADYPMPKGWNVFDQVAPEPKAEPAPLDVDTVPEHIREYLDRYKKWADRGKQGWAPNTPANMGHWRSLKRNWKGTEYYRERLAEADAASIEIPPKLPLEPQAATASGPHDAAAAEPAPAPSTDLPASVPPPLSPDAQAAITDGSSATTAVVPESASPPDQATPVPPPLLPEAQEAITDGRESSTPATPEPVLPADLAYLPPVDQTLGREQVALAQEQVSLLRKLVTNTASQSQDTPLGVRSGAPDPSEDR